MSKPKNPDVATTLNNLAALYESMGDYEQALIFYKKERRVLLTLKNENALFFISKLSKNANFSKNGIII